VITDLLLKSKIIYVGASPPLDYNGCAYDSGPGSRLKKGPMSLYAHPPRRMRFVSDTGWCVGCSQALTGYLSSGCRRPLLSVVQSCDGTTVCRTPTLSRTLWPQQHCDECGLDGFRPDRPAKVFQFFIDLESCKASTRTVAQDLDPRRFPVHPGADFAGV
jgi:hypothetical protein